MEKYRVRPDQVVKLSEYDPNETSCFKGSKSKAQVELEKLNARIAYLQEVLYTQKKHRILLILQAMDTAGKDGVIRHVLGGVNPQGVIVANFKAPSSEELAHDYLWRIHQKVPGRGEIVVFNRSHYEDVLVVRIHNLVESNVWRKRFDHINCFEKMLADEDVTILKFYLHISKDEQKQRLIDRLNTPEKQWKFNPSDLEERKHWDKYMMAYEDVLSKTSTDWAPWYIIPANYKYYRNLVVAQILIERLESLKMSFPLPAYDPRKIKFD